MPPLNGRNITSMMQTPSLLMRSKSRLSMTLGWAQSRLLSLVTLGKTVSTKIHCIILSFRYELEIKENNIWKKTVTVVFIQ